MMLIMFPNFYTMLELGLSIHHFSDRRKRIGGVATLAVFDAGKPSSKMGNEHPLGFSKFLDKAISGFLFFHILGIIIPTD